MARLLVIALLGLGALGACSDEGSQRCRDACDRADECSDKVKDPNYKFDKGECNSACAFLEKDSEGQKLITAYAQCMKSATTCDEVNACE